MSPLDQAQADLTGQSDQPVFLGRRRFHSFPGGVPNVLGSGTIIDGSLRLGELAEVRRRTRYSVGMSAGKG